MVYERFIFEWWSYALIYLFIYYNVYVYGHTEAYIQYNNEIEIANH